MKTRAPLSKVLLAVLADMGKATYNLYTMVNDLRRYQSAFLQGGHEYVREIKRLQRERDLRQTIYRLRRAHYVRAQKIGRKILVTLTRKGYLATLTLRMRKAPPHPSKLHTVVIFDIPESQRLIRRQVRLVLRESGFSKLQQSVWISKLDVYRLVIELIRQMKANKWIHVLQVTDSWPVY